MIRRAGKVLRLIRVMWILWVFKVNPFPFLVIGRACKVLRLIRVMWILRVFKVNLFHFLMIGQAGKVLLLTRVMRILRVFKVNLFLFLVIGRAEVGVLNRNIAGSARLVSSGTCPAYVAWRAGTKSANLAQPCLKLLLQARFFFSLESCGFSRFSR